MNAFFRMKKFIDWTRVYFVLALEPPSNLKLDSKIKTKFLRRIDSIINTKLNPRFVSENIIKCSGFK